jgi:GDP-L-fucose synthase
MYRLAGKRVWVCGHRGMAGSAIVRRLASEDCTVLTAPRGEVDLRDGHAVRAWMAANKPDFVFMAAAKVGGILANRDFPADFLYDNLMIEANVVKAAAETGVEKLLMLGSSCIYPKFAPQPMHESALLTGPLESTNEWYALAKIAGIKLCQAFRAQHGCDFISAMPTNLYGFGDNFDLTSSHVLPALIRKVHDAKTSGRDTVEIWGTGSPLREFLNVDDLADACIHLAKTYSDPIAINVGSGQEISIKDLAHLIGDVVGFNGTFVFDASKPDGTPRKLLDCSLLRSTGWEPRIGLREGISETYRWYLEHLAGGNLRQ